MENIPSICSRCILDTTIPDIKFDANGVCNYCAIHDQLDQDFPLGPKGQEKLEKIVAQIRSDGKGKDYDIIVGVSGGRDSTYGLYQTVKLGLRPLAVHFDNGWNSEIAVSNIKNATKKLDVDLHTYVVDWDEFKDLQISFLKASVSDAEIPTDVGIHGILHKIAAQENVKHILFAHSFRTEGFAPLGWTYMDGKYIESVQERFGTRPLVTFPNFSMTDYLYYRFIKGIKVVPLLALIEYDQKEVEKLLERELGWTFYGGHHHESYYTHFFQSFYLPQKFNIDKRKLEYSALIRSGQITRARALERMKEEGEYPYDQELVNYTISKLGMTQAEFDAIMSAENKTFRDYKTYYPFMRKFKFIIKIMSDLKMIPTHLYLRYFG